MNKYFQALKDDGYSPLLRDGGFVESFVFEANRWWIDETPGKWRMESTDEFYPVSALVSPDGVIQLYDSQEGDPLAVSTIRVEDADLLPSILGQLAKAFCDETSPEEGTEIINGLLT